MELLETHVLTAPSEIVTLPDTHDNLLHETLLQRMRGGLKFLARLAFEDPENQVTSAGRIL